MTEPRISKTRRRIAWEAACLLLYRRETEIYKAKLVAGKRLCGGWVPRRELPTNQEVLNELARISEPGACLDEPDFGQVADAGWLESKGKLPPRTEKIVAQSDFAWNDTPIDQRPDCIDRWQQFLSLLRPLENIRMPHPFYQTGDALFHSLQAFEHAVANSPYDEELLLAALLHEVGRAVDSRDPVVTSIELLADDVSERTAWLIENLPEANKLHLGTIGHRSLRRLRENENYEDLILLSECDRQACEVQANVRQAEDALDYIAALDQL
jgi:hypothetical protein